MTIKDLRNKIAESKNVNFFNNIETEIQLPHINYSKKLVGLVNIYKFFEEQANGWVEISKTYSGFDNSVSYFQNFKSRILNFINQFLQYEDLGVIKSQWNGINIEIISNNENILTFDCSETKFLTNLKDEKPEYFNGALVFYTGRGAIQFNNKNDLHGTLLAYEFSLNGKSLLKSRLKDEKDNLTKIKNDFQKFYNETEIQLVANLSKSNENFVNHVKKIDDFKEEKELAFNNWYDDVNNKFNVFDKTSKEKINDLEKTYEELLRLKKPAEYWNTRAKNLKKEGRAYLIWLIILIVLACSVLYSLLWLTPGGMLESFTKDTTTAIRWSIIFITLISLLVFSIRLVTKIVFSSFHLARDAEEREQLAYVYLSLIKDSSIGENEKQLVMQALFSRAETGLLNEDSSPTMPNDLIGKILNKS